MNPKTKTEKIERKILWISFAAGSIFTVMEFFIAIYTRSQSVLMDAAYDASELIIIGLTLFLTPLFHKPISEKRPFGYSQVESIFVVIKSFMMISVTLGLSANTIELAFTGGNNVNSTVISIFQLILGIISIIILIYMKHLNKSIISPIITSEISGWTIDTYYSLGMSVAFFISFLLENTMLNFISPYFDPIIVLIVVISTIPQIIQTLYRGIKDVFLFSPETETMEIIKEVSSCVLDKYNFTPEFYDVTRTGRRVWVCVYFSTNTETLIINELREATQDINSALSNSIGNCVCELIIKA